MKNLRRLAYVVVAFGTVACSPIIDQRGNLPEPQSLAKIEPGRTTQDEVMALLGTPSTTLNYGEETWHYISARTETVAFFKPTETERTVVTLVFDKSGKVKDMTTRGLKDGKEIDLVSRQTPTAGKDMSVLDQLIGNVGKFNKDAKAE